MKAQCPICQTFHVDELQPYEGRLNDTRRCRCFRCGEFETTLHDVAFSPEERAFISHTIRWNQVRKIHPETYRKKDAENILQNCVQFSPIEKQNNLIAYLAEYEAAGKYVDARECGLLSLMGVAVPDTYAIPEYEWLCKDLSDRGLIESPDRSEGDVIAENKYRTFPFMRVKLTVTGWQYWEELKRSGVGSKQAFMAMMFPKEEGEDNFEISKQIEAIFKALQQEVAKTGFSLDNPLLSTPRNGLIDDHLEVAIKTSRFVVADLTGGNQGAYWEAGLARGLGKPVFYICKADISEKPHFDTNHHVTIFWEVGKEQEAAEKLKHAIRNSIPEARMED